MQPYVFPIVATMTGVIILAVYAVLWYITWRKDDTGKLPRVKANSKKTTEELAKKLFSNPKRTTINWSVMDDDNAVIIAIPPKSLTKDERDKFGTLLGCYN
jgi:hypothetical protein